MSYFGREETEYEEESENLQSAPLSEREERRREKVERIKTWAQQKYVRKRLSFWEYTIFLAMTLLFLVLAYSLANMLHALYSEYVLQGRPVDFRHYFLMCTLLLLIFFALDRYFFGFSVLPY